MNILDINRKVSKIKSILDAYFKVEEKDTYLYCSSEKGNLLVLPIIEKSFDFDTFSVKEIIDNKMLLISLFGESTFDAEDSIKKYISIITFESFAKLYEINRIDFVPLLFAWMHKKYEYDAIEIVIKKQDLIIKQNSDSNKNHKILEQKSKTILENVFSDKLGKIIHKEKRKYVDENGTTVIISLESKDYFNGKKDSKKYWYSIHQYQIDIIKEIIDGYFSFSFKDNNDVVLIPAAYILELLKDMNTTTNDRETYYHIHIFYYSNIGYQMLVPHKGKRDMNQYLCSNIEYKSDSNDSDNKHVPEIKDETVVRLNIGSGFREVKQRH